jgi:hypothetical protein
MKLLTLALAALFGSSLAQDGPVDNPVEPDALAVEYMDGNHTLLGHLSIPDGDGPFPAVIVIP